MAKRKATPADPNEKLLAAIVQESKTGGTDATRRSARIGKLCIKFLDEVPGTEGRKAIQERLIAEGLDSNITRSIQVHALVRLVPEAIGLPLSVAATITPLVRYGKTGPEYRLNEDDNPVADVPTIVDKAIKDKWTAQVARREIAKVRQPTKRAARKAPQAAKKAIQVIAEAHVDDLSDALVTCPTAEKKMREVLQSFKMAIQAVAKADFDDLSEALVSCPAAERKLRRVLQSFDETKAQWPENQVA